MNQECPQLRLGAFFAQSKRKERLIITVKEANIALLSTIPEDAQQQIFVYLTQNFCGGNPFKPMSADEIYSELAESRACYERGEYEDFDTALDDIGKKYGL